jgi:hypothetical protein
MSFQGVQGIAIAYIRRKFKGTGRERGGINPSDYSPTSEIDAPFPLQHECVCLHISLQALELLSNPKFPPGSSQFRTYAETQPPPFRELARIRSSAALDSLTLVEHDGMPFVVVVKRPDRVVIKDLTTTMRSTLRCAPFEPFSDLDQNICRAAVFPAQGQILVVRSVPSSLPVPEATPMYLFELYNCPERGGNTTAEAMDRFIVDNRHIADFQISDHNIATQHDRSIQPSLPAALGPPPPVSIFCRTVEPHGLHHFIVWPTHVDIPPSPGSKQTKSYYYSLSNVTFQSRHDSDHVIPHVLPGAYRTLIYTVPSDDRRATPSLLDLRRYVTPEAQPYDYPRIDRDANPEERVMKDRKNIPFNIFSSLVMPNKLATTLREDGVTAVAWDEGIGRVCIASSDDSTIHILDFAQNSKCI